MKAIKNLFVFDGFISEKTLYVVARVMTRRDVDENDGDNWLQTFRNTIGRFRTNEIPFEAVKLSIDKNEVSKKADAEGYLSFNIPLKSALIENVSLETAMTSVNPPLYRLKKESRLAIICDIDDTLLKTEVHSKYRMLYNSIFKPSWKRADIPGASKFLNALAKYTSDAANPVLYVTNSPYNLFDYIKSYLKNKNFPDGPVFMRDFDGFSSPKTIDNSPKYLHIKTILESYDKPTILIGDSVDNDFEIYASLAESYSDQIRHMFIHLVAQGRSRQSLENNLIYQSHPDRITFFQSFDELMPLISKETLSL